MPKSCILLILGIEITIESNLAGCSFKLASTPDDLIDTGSTFVKCAEALKNKGADRIIGVCTHAVFSGAAIEKINKSDAVSKVFVTDTIPPHWDSPKIEIISIAELLAEAIVRTHENASISSLFEIIR